MAKAKAGCVTTSETWEGFHFTCNADQAMWLFAAMKDAQRAVQARPHHGFSGDAPYEQFLTSADQWKFYGDLAAQCMRYAVDNKAHPLWRYPDGRMGRNV